MVKIMKTKIKLLLVFVLVTTVTFAQKSPRKQANGKIGETSIEVDYGAPSVKERVVWGELVPYNKVWRAGANENTTVSFDKDVTINNTSVPAGKYGLFIIPAESGKWEVILSKKNDAWGSKGYTEDNDLLRLKVNVKIEPNIIEMMIFSVSENGISFAWEKARFEIAIK